MKTVANDRLAVSADGTVRTLPDGFDPQKLRAMLTANGGEAIHE